MNKKAKIKKSFDEILNHVPADYYHKGVKSNFLQKYWHTKKWKTLEKFLRNQSSGKLLDVGCADGTTTLQIHKNFPKLKITGIDAYDKAVNFAKKTKTKINFIVADAHKLPFKNSTFDIIITIETLEHLENPRLALSEIRRVLKRRGFLIIGQDTDSTLFKLVWWIWTKSKGSVWSHSHINCVTPDILIRNVKSAGFKIKKVENINLGMEVFVKALKV